MKQDYVVTVTATGSLSKWGIFNTSSREEAKKMALDEFKGSIFWDITDVDYTTMEAEVDE